MERKPVESSTIKSIGYDPETGVLEIEFIGGREYRYFDVADHIHAEFLQAKSKGHFFYSKIKSAHPYERIDKGVNNATSTEGRGPGDL